MGPVVGAVAPPAAEAAPPEPADAGAVSVRRQLLIGGAAVGSVLALMAAVGAYGAARAEPFSVFAKEPIEQFGADTYIGLLAHVTWFLWVIAATAALFTAALIRRQGARARQIGFLVALAFLSTILLADDFMMLHERVLPGLGVPETGLYLLYAAMLLAILAIWRGEVVRGGGAIAVLSGVFWAASLGFDRIQGSDVFGGYHHALEDGSKLLGTALWTAFVLTVALQWASGSLGAVTGPSGATDPVPVGSSTMSKRTSKKKANVRRKKANHGRKPNAGRNS